MANAFSIERDNQSGILKRFWIYQKERFPLFGHVPLVASFSFSAIAYSRICSGSSARLNEEVGQGFVPWNRFFVGIFTTITLFLLVRIFDEFKDRKDDEKYRPELPIPRGLVSLNELAVLGVLVFVMQIILNAVFFPKMLIIYFVVIGYLALMGKEFFAGEWLRKHQFWYVTSHMFIIPLVDIYASGLDWLVDGNAAPKGLLFFFAVSYFNGIVLEVGRKIRVPENESEGVLTYSAMLGATKATWLFIGVLFLTLCCAIGASWFAGYGMAGFYLLSAVFLVCLIPAMLFLRRMSARRSKMIEYASGVWTIAMYLSLGGIPMLINMLSR